MVDDEKYPSAGRVSDEGRISHAIFRVARTHKMLARQLLREIGLYPGQELLMMQLWDDGPQRQVDLVRTLDSDAPTMARSIARLERAGFVRRSPNPADGRSVLVEATPASMSLRRSVERIWTELEALTVGSLTHDEQAAVLDALGEIEAQLQVAGGARPSAAD